MHFTLPLLVAFAASAEGQTLQGAKSGPIPVAFVLTDSATMIDFAGPWEVFQDVHVESRGSSHEDQMPFRLYTVSGSREPIRTSGGMTVVPDHTFADAPPPKVVVVGAQRGAPGLVEWLKRVAADPRTDVVMSVCTGAFKLGEAGLLDGKPATTHHDFHDTFARRFPSVKLERGRRFVRSDARIFTAGGLSSGIDLALHVVDLYFGREVAQRTADYMEYQGAGWKEPVR
ncbi:MAG TPA: DJ-1/PfpI family protein [Vicinamibacteria bacterium]|nr:DJ-1/PfpI family protein [Vicinamibacteria bacterium]